VHTRYGTVVIFSVKLLKQKIYKYTNTQNIFSIHAILPVWHFPLLHFQSLPFMCNVAITAVDAAAAAAADGGGRSISSSATFHVNLSAVQCLLARVQPAVTIVVGTGDGRAARAVLRPAGRMARRIYDRNK